eukprot:TRINITY_DN7757_c0_g1_i1.p1 TRINITY_DN7757_c0_g1~~TRINITY_DN7757_c0_g1_i1.p1  ORF type:complete len:198 (-),score=25.43 TRINITY_DN7757_c0_g1_i1:177-770(-)
MCIRDRFTIRRINVNRDYKLRIIFSDKECSPRGLELSILVNKKLYVRLSESKSKFASSDPFFENVTLENANLWVLFAKDVMYVGIGNSISLASTILKFEHPFISQIEYFSFPIEHNFNIIMDQIFISGNQRLEETIALMDEVRGLNLTNPVVYHEHYGNGTFCDPINAGRKTTIVYKCSTNGALLEVSHEKICEKQF